MLMRLSIADGAMQSTTLATGVKLTTSMSATRMEVVATMAMRRNASLGLML